MGEVGTLCSGLPGCYCGQGGGGLEGERVVVPVDSCLQYSLVLGVLEAIVCVWPDQLVTGVHVPTQLPRTAPPTHPQLLTQFPLHNSPTPHSSPQLPAHSSTHSSPHMSTRVNVKPDEDEHTNSNVGTHNIAIGSTLG